MTTYSLRRAFSRCVIWLISVAFCSMVTIILCELIQAETLTLSRIATCTVGSAIAATIVLLFVPDEAAGIRV